MEIYVIMKTLLINFYFILILCLSTTSFAIAETTNTDTREVLSKTISESLPIEEFHISDHKNGKLLLVKAKGESSVFNLTPMPSIFSEDASIEVLIENQTKTLNPRNWKSHTYWTQPNSQSRKWAFITIQEDQTIKGMITSEDGSKVMQIYHKTHLDLKKDSIEEKMVKIKLKSNGYLIRDIKYDADLFKNENKEGQSYCGVTTNPSVKETRNPRFTNFTSTITTSENSDPVSASESGYIPFFPQCYNTDVIQREFKIGIATDLGFFQASGASIDKTTLEIESLVASARIVYLAQLNILLKVGKLIITTGANSSSFPLSMSPNSGTCVMDSTSVLSSFGNWNQSNNTSANGNAMGLWHLLTNCWQAPGVVGIANINSLCDIGRNVGITSRLGSTGQSTWLIFAHELGHGFGALHTFQNGVGKTGGIMDYGNPYVNGVAQFNPIGRADICGGINSEVNTCPYFKPTSQGAVCGNSVLEKTEDCECLNGSQSCTGCENCKLTQNNVQCSNKSFIMRTTFEDQSQPFITADSLHLSDPVCCTDAGTLKDATTTCNGGADVCVTGKCTKFCSKYLLTSCSVINNGCKQTCSYQSGGECFADLKTQTTQTPISWMPNGVSCDKGKGVCLEGNCTSGNCDSNQPPTFKYSSSGGYVPENTTCQNSIKIKGKTYSGCIPFSAYQPARKKILPPQSPSSEVGTTSWCYTGTGNSYSSGKNFSQRLRWGYCKEIQTNPCQ